LKIHGKSMKKQVKINENPRKTKETHEKSPKINEHQ